MTAQSLFRALTSDRRGASAAEFALVLPLLLILLFGIIDAGRLLWELNRAKKATQYGARIAAVVNPVEQAIADEQFIGKVVGGTTLLQGTVIPASAMGPVICQTATDVASVTCDSTASGLTSPKSVDTAAFGFIFNRMDVMFPQIEPSNVVVTYEGSGLGYAGNPYGADVAPLITVGLRNVQFEPITLLLFASFSLPDVESTLTSEDLRTHSFSTGTTGSQSN